MLREAKRRDGWTPALQREFIARLAHGGSPARAARQMRKNLSGVLNVHDGLGAESFQAAWAGAVALAERRQRAAREAAKPFVGRAPGIKVRSAASPAGPAPLPGQILNELGEWEDEASVLAHGEKATVSICEKLLRIRRLFLAEISHRPGKRAAFEILTELPVDWARAASGEAQDDEPYRSANQRHADMVVLAESGWSWGEWGYGPDRKAEARRALDAHRAGAGMPAIEWDEE